MCAYTVTRSAIKMATVHELYTSILGKDGALVVVNSPLWIHTAANVAHSDCSSHAAVNSELAPVMLGACCMFETR